MTDAQQRMELGVLRRLKVRCVSETGWFDDATLLGDVKAAGGMSVSQYQLRWPPFGDLHPENAAGSSALIEAEEVDGRIHKLLFDTGWGAAWMEKRFAEEGIDKMLADGEIECLIISHEHFDHFWGIGATLRHRPDITIYLPAGFHQEGMELIKANGHRGQLITARPDEPLLLFPGFALVNFEMSTLLQVQGENVLYCGIQDKGIAMLTGCGHGGVIQLLEYAGRTFENGERIHAVYGGLHISPFGEWDNDREQLVAALGRYPIEKLGCNHCTGPKAVQKMIDMGLPVVRGSARNGSRTDLFLGNGDTLELG
ncbi:MAG: MBL fold metallo-hydrolase [Sterolibacteriaceae bacterium]|nr:MBL fold metallo-hydrolase [Sterolibacteriaceae bacterium]MBK9083867.1 MBL fold metallo-hydrolase [Sterolibacteriaceae bacterium]